MAQAKEKPAEEKQCPVRAEFERVELTEEQSRVIRVLSEVLGISKDAYMHAFSHGANYAKLNA